MTTLSSLMTTPVSSPAERASGNFALVETLRRWGIMFFSGVNGGGLIHVAKHMEPFTDLAQANDGIPRMLTMSEYVSGFVPVGYYLASGRIAGCMATTGAATKLASSGLTDAKLHNVPAVYIVALNSTLSVGLAPLQDVSVYGMNIVPQLQAELGDGGIVIDDITKVETQLRRAQQILLESRPVAIAFHPDILSKPTDVDVPPVEKRRTFVRKDVEAFLEAFPTQAERRRVILYVCSEATRCPQIQDLTTQFSEVLHAPTVWSVNGASAVSRSNRYGYGYISFGGNDKAMELWRSITRDDIVIALGFDAGEYSLNLGKIPAGVVWHFTDLPEAYGHKHGEVRHRVAGEYRLVRGDIGCILEEILPRLRCHGLQGRPEAAAPENLNTRMISRDVKPGCVDFIAFYEALDRCWRPHSIGFDDVCVAYKDRQYVTQRPHPHIRFYTTHDGSAMGGAFGLGVGAKIADPSLHTFVFAGDGCWRLFGGALADAATIDLRVFIINNGTYAIVDKGLEVVVPEVDKQRYHSKLPGVDFVAAAKAYGWDGYSLDPDLGNLEEIMDACYTGKGQSILVDVPVDTDQVIGLNPRLLNLTVKTYL
ncbi:MAG: thiamine pyrophosphate-binding protein [Armatimonadetes bacterium]|nr:thiamine pyrophosphate-binding protein [Armatimonadota bacterium]